MFFKTEKSAFEAGYLHAETGARLRDNPYPLFTKKRGDWRRGFKAYRAAQARDRREAFFTKR